MQTVFTNCAPFVLCEFPSPRRVIGVRVFEPFVHQGLHGQPLVCEVEVERPSFNTATFAKIAVPVADLRKEVTASTLDVIAALDRSIAELSAHRERLLTSVHALPTAVFPTEAGARSA